MATTPRGIPLIDGATKVAPFQAFFNAIAQALDIALGTIDSDLSVVKAQANALRGTPTERAATTGKHGQTWQDTDTNRLTWIASETGVWRRAAGKLTVATGSLSQIGGINIYGTTITIPVPTVAPAGYEVQVTAHKVGNSFGIISMHSQSVSGATTNVLARFVQPGSSNAQDLDIQWQLVPVA